MCLSLQPQVTALQYQCAHLEQTVAYLQQVVNQLQQQPAAPAAAQEKMESWVKKAPEENPFHKTRMCTRFTSPGGCSFGDRCNFAHDAADLRPVPIAHIDGTWDSSKRRRES